MLETPTPNTLATPTADGLGQIEPPAAAQTASKNSEQDPDGIVVDDAKLRATAIRRQRRRGRIADLRKATAEDLIGTIDENTELFGLTGGQFSLSELLEVILRQTGPARFTVSTWTCANIDLDHLERLLSTGALTGLRFLIDNKFHRRQPAIFAKLRALTGDNGLRVLRNHAKFATVTGGRWPVTITTTMNLNKNLRLEQFGLSTDPELAGFLDGFADSLFATKKPPR